MESETSRRRWIQNSGPRIVGEFVLIVSSVLVALAVDQYVETRNERGFERQYLARLIDDVGATTGALEASRRSFIRAEIAARYLDSLFAAPSASAPRGSTLYLATQRATRSYTPTYARGTLDEMVSAGTLRLLEDRELRGAVMTFYRWEETHDWMWQRLDQRFWTVARGVELPESNDRFFDDCAYDVHPAECDVAVPGIDGNRLWRELRALQGVNGMLRSLIRDCVRTQELLTDQIERAESLMADLQENMLR